MNSPADDVFDSPRPCPAAKGTEQTGSPQASDRSVTEVSSGNGTPSVTDRRTYGGGFIMRIGRKFRAWFLDNFINLYPPFFGAGIKVTHVSPDYRTFKVRMKLNAFNRNYVGTHYGGSLYSMCDPFYMLMLMKNLGREYVVWDKAATIQFKKPGRGTVHAAFRLSQDQIDRVKARVDANGKTEETFKVDVLDENEQVIATVEKLIYIRKR